MTTSMPGYPAPNHHADHPGFSGVSGLLAGVTMIFGRGGVARLAADLAAVTNADHVVDVGCGPGAAARKAAHRGAAVTGIDPAPVMLTLARRLTRRGTSITWIEGAAEALPLPDGSATVLWSISTAHHWHDLEVALAEARRVLAPHGRLLVVERRSKPGATGLASHGWTEAQSEAFAETCNTAGFAHVRAETQRRGRNARLVVLATRP